MSVSDLISARFIWTIDLLKDIRDYTTSDTRAPMLRNKEENGLLNTCNMMKSVKFHPRLRVDRFNKIILQVTLIGGFNELACKIRKAFLKYNV